MSRRSRSEQARLNGAKSRGPKTPEGKARSSMNSLKHGLYAKHPVRLFFESNEDYDQLLDDLLQQFRPATLAERRLVETLAELEYSYNRTQFAYTTYLERLLRYASPSRLKLPPTDNPVDTLVAAEEEAIARSRYLEFLNRQLARLLMNRSRVLRMLKSYKRDFPPRDLEPEPTFPQSSDPRFEETVDTFQCVREDDFFPKPLGKSTTSPLFNPTRTNPLPDPARSLYSPSSNPSSRSFPSAVQPISPQPSPNLRESAPSAPPDPLPKAA